MKFTVTHHVILAFLAVVMTPSFATSYSKTEGEEARIVGGYNAVKGRYPYMVSLQSWSRHECGAVLVASDVVLTAAHCLDGDIVKAFVGRYDLKDETETDSQVIDVNYHVIHPDYTLETDRHDIGIYKLMEETDLPPIVMNQNPSLLVDGMELTVMGFGDLGNFTYPNILQEVQVNYIPEDPCRNFEDPMKQDMNYRSSIFNDMMCALGDGKDGCSGDSGGPLVVRGDTYEKDVLVGTTSWGIGCARLPGVYARVDAMYEWISETVCRVAANPPAYLQCSQTPPGPSPTMAQTMAPSPAPVATLPEFTSQPSSVMAPTLPLPAPVATLPEFTSQPSSVNGNSVPTTSEQATWPPQIALFSTPATEVFTEDRDANYDGGDVSMVTPTLTEEDINSGNVRLCLWVTCLLLLISTTMLLVG